MNHLKYDEGCQNQVKISILMKTVTQMIESFGTTSY